MAPLPAATSSRGNVQLTIPLQLGVNRYTVEVLDPKTLKPVEPAQHVPGGVSTVQLPHGHWRIRVAPEGGQGAFYDFVQVHPQGTAVAVGNFTSAAPSPQPFGMPSPTSNPAALGKVNHWIIIYMENQSFDAVFPYYNGADDLRYAGQAAAQLTLKGESITSYAATSTNTVLLEGSIIGSVTGNYTIPLGAGPYDLEKLVPTHDLTGDTDHLFVKEQRQIQGGNMTHFAAWSSNPGVTQGHYNQPTSALYQYAQQGVLCDQFHHSAFGDTWLNEFWFVSGASPVWGGTPPVGASPIAYPTPSPIPSPEFINLQATSPTDRTLNNALGAINGTNYILQFPPGYPYERGVGFNAATTQYGPTIADRLNAKGVSWTWYGEEDFVINPLLWFANTTIGSPNYSEHFVTSGAETGQGFVAACQSGDLPTVSFVRPELEESLHPELSTYEAGQTFLRTVVGAVQAQPSIWNDCAIIITTDENGGRWDHVAPPAGDAFGPGTRIPTIVLSPFVKKGTVNHTTWETLSILKTLQVRYGLASLSPRVDAAADLSGLFTQ